MKTENSRIRKLMFMVMACAFIVCSMLMIFSACEKKEEDEPVIGPCPSVTAYCKFEYEKEVYDINNVEVTFYSGDTFMQKWWCQGQKFDPTQIEFTFEEGTDEYQMEYESLLNKYESYQKYRPQYCDFYFTSFGKKNHIKRITELEFDGENGYATWKHRETVKIPSELFVNEYGAIYYSWEMTPEGDGGSEYLGGYGCCVYYKKDGNKIYISKEDLKPEENLNNYNGNAFLRMESLTDYLNIRVPNFEKDSEGDLALNIYIGRTYPKEDGYDSAKLYFISENDGEKGKKFLKEIDYSDDSFLCDILYNYDGIPSAVIYKHKETLSIPKEYVTGEEKVGIVLYGQKNGVEIPLSFWLFKYTYALREFEGGKILEEYCTSIVRQEQFEEFLQGKK